MNETATTRPGAGPLSQRQIAKQFGISRARQWRARRVAEIPEAEFEAMIESDNPPTITQLAEYGRETLSDKACGMNPLQKAWRAASPEARVAFSEWLANCNAP